MTGVLLRQPNYTCTETVERSRQAAGSHSKVEDTLRLEVALVDGKEMFAWPGSKQFEDHDLSDLVSTGMFGNGNFAIYARILFLTKVATFQDRGETELDGHRTWRYDFQVPRLTSGQWLKVNKQEAQVGFHGSFYADPVTFDVRRLQVIADDIPQELGVLEAEIGVDYGRVRIGEEKFLLPVESNLMMAMPDVVSRNSVRFADCRRFAGESTLSFDDPVLTEASAKTERIEEVEIPSGLTLQLDMPGLDLMRTAVGDTVRAMLRGDLRNRRQLLAPKGSIAHGRIVRLDRYTSYFLLQIEFQDLEWTGGHARLKLRFDQTAFVSRLITPAQDGNIMISRQVGPRLSGILMFWRSE